MDLLHRYLAVRRAAGFKMVDAEWNLVRFVQAAQEAGDTHVRTGTAIQWASTARSPQARNRRMHHVAIFAKHVKLEDSRHEIPPTGVFAFRPQRRPPHLYTDAEIRALVLGAGKIRNPRPETFATVFALLAATGMRVSEALQLQLRDLTSDGLVIRETKFRKSRLLPLHASTHAALAAYRDRWRAAAGPEEPLFASTRGRPFSYSTIDKVFLRVARTIGLRGPPGRIGERCDGPRIHDLRHTFAVRSLEACPNERDAVGRHTVALTTYLGHASVASTCWYLHASPTLMTDIADACAALDQAGGDA